MSKKDILGHTAYDIAPTHLANLYAAADKELFDGARNQVYSANVDGRDGQRRVDFRKSVFYTAQHEIAGFIGAINDNAQGSNVGVGGIKAKGITPRELEVLNLLVKGQSAKAIADNLAISIYTVSDHIKAIYMKLDVHSKNEAIYKALSFFATEP